MKEPIKAQALSELLTPQHRIFKALSDLNEFKMLAYSQMSFEREVKAPDGSFYNPNDSLERQIIKLEEIEKNIRNF